MKRTPGPWRLLSDGLSVFGAGPNSQQVADLGVCSPNIRKREQLANARLIAASPELLDALRAFCDGGHDLSAVYSEALAAIAKAEGR